MKAGQGVSCGRALRIFTLLEFHVRQYSAYPSSEGQCGVTPAPPPTSGRTYKWAAQFERRQPFLERVAGERGKPAAKMQEDLYVGLKSHSGFYL